MDQRRVVLGVALSILFLVLYQEFVFSRYARKSEHVVGETASAPDVPEIPAVPVEIASNREIPAEGAGEPQPPLVTIDTDILRAQINLRGGRLQSLELKAFRKDVSQDSGALDLVRPGAVLPLTLLSGASESDAGVLYHPDQPGLSIRTGEHGALLLTGADGHGNRFEKRLVFSGDRYDFDVEASAQGPSPARDLALVLTELPQLGSATADMSIVLADGHLIEKKASDFPKGNGGDSVIKAPQWAGFAVQYFLAVAIPKMGGTAAELVSGPGELPMLRIRAAATDGRAVFTVFMGPKSREVLAQVGHDVGRALDFGWFWFIAVPLLAGLRAIDRLTGNYGVAIIVLTALVKAVTIPLTRSTFKNMGAMRKLQPQIEALKGRHKDDPMAQQRETMELYRKHGLNPLSGCLPMVLQLPVFVGLYNALSHAIELRHAPFFLWITDLSAPDRLSVAGYAIPVLTLLMGASMLLQQWMTPQQGDPAQQKMMMIMPLMFTYMFVSFPSGLVLYWLVNNVLTIGQQYVLLRGQT